MYTESRARQAGTDEERTVIALRLKVQQREAIKASARARGLSMTQYMLRASLGTLSGVGLEQRIDELERRMDRLEELGYGT